jgi:hypothetical protein
MAGLMIIGKAKSFYDEMKIADRCPFSEGSDKKISCKNFDQYRYCLMCTFSQGSDKHLPVRN